MHRKRILLFSLFFSILVGSLFYYVLLPRITARALRRDSIPSGAYVVPWMEPNPSFVRLPEQSPNGPPVFDIDAVMVGALKLDMTFRINMGNGNTRVIPSTMYLGHDSDYLYVGGKFVGMYTNPTSEPNGWTEENYLKIYFDADDDNVLKSPESGSCLAVGVYAPFEYISFWTYSDITWQEDNEYNRLIWWLAENWYSSRNLGQRVFAFANQANEYDNQTGTVTILFSRFLSRPGSAEFNALQIRSGERWVMGFLLELGYANGAGVRSDFVDGWPRKIYPYLSNDSSDSSWWPKLAIDLTNPPVEFST